MPQVGNDVLEWTTHVAILEDPRTGRAIRRPLARDDSILGVEGVGAVVDEEDGASGRPLSAAAAAVAVAANAAGAASNHGARSGAAGVPPTAPAAAADASAPVPADARDAVEWSKHVAAAFREVQLAPVWAALGRCLAVIEEHRDLAHVASVLMPSIETLFLVASRLRADTAVSADTAASAEAAGSASSGASAAAASSPPRPPLLDEFDRFVEAHRRTVNEMIRANNTLMAGAFALLMDTPHLLDFDIKRTYFNQQLHVRRTRRDHMPVINLHVRRDHVFEDSFQQIMNKDGEGVKHGRLHVRFVGEAGIDAGGVTREWYQVLCTQMFNPDYALFVSSAVDKTTYQPNRVSGINHNHLLFFQFVGRVIGKAVYEGRTLDAYFTRYDASEHGEKEGASERGGREGAREAGRGASERGGREGASERGGREGRREGRRVAHSV